MTSWVWAQILNHWTISSVNFNSLKENCLIAFLVLMLDIVQITAQIYLECDL